MKKKTTPHKKTVKKKDSDIPKLDKREEIEDVEETDEVAELDQAGDEEPETLEEDRY